MNNLNVVVLKDEIVENRREMGELEIQGAMLYIYQLVKSYNMEHFGENFTTLEEVDSYTYYCNEYLEITDGGYKISDEDGNTIILDSVFMREGNKADLWGYAYLTDSEDEDRELYTVRI